MGALKLPLLAIGLAWANAARADPLDRWAFEIAQASARFGVPEPWIRRVMRIESRGATLLHGQPITSPAGAMGLMQVMPGTWAEMRGRLGLGADPHDPHDNILAGTLYLRLMYDRFGYPGLFGAYNAGPARYTLYLRNARPLPAETRRYVALAAGPLPSAIGLRGLPTPALFVVQPADPSYVPPRLRVRPPAGLFVALNSGAR